MNQVDVKTESPVHSSDGKAQPVQPVARIAPRALPAARRSRSNLVISLILGAIILAGTGFLIYYIYFNYIAAHAGGGAAGKGTARPTPVIAVKAKSENYDLYLNALGTVAPNNSVTVRTRVDGQLKLVAFKEDDLVKEGDLLALIDDKPFVAQRAQAEGQLARDEASIVSAQKDVDRYAQVGPEVVPQQTIDTANATLKNLQGAVKADNAAIQAAQVMIDYCRITSPLTGRAGLRLVDQGNQVHASDPGGLVVINQVQPIVVNFTIPQDAIPQLQAAVKRDPKLPISAVSSDDKTLIATGELLAMDNQIDSTTGTLKIKATFKNQDDTLFPNQFVNIHVLVETLKDVVTVDSAAIQHGPKGTFVYVAKKDASKQIETPSAETPPAIAASRPGGPPAEIYTVEMRYVEVDHDNGTAAVIKEKLDAGEIIVTSGVDKLIDGAKVTLRFDDTAKNKSSAMQRSTQPSKSPATRRSANTRPAKEPA